ncbi:hypothetical protein DM860_010159 [Cuscuta australis]|uniref:Uncharacterized protein n=1 Tax=Cuscuta australis TaxID=267555 RepID=A0A328D6L5_9ASTE|nr:hypothetical protein DM860_010159 [Cuscuta australis]
MKVLLVFYLCSTSLRSKVPSLLFGMQYEYVMTNLRLTILCSVLSSFIFLSIATCPEFTLLLCVSTTPSKKLKLSQGKELFKTPNGNTLFIPISGGLYISWLFRVLTSKLENPHI